MQIINETFNEDELKAVALDFEMDWENITGTKKDQKITALVSYFQRRGKLDILINWLAGLRPDADWPKTIFDTGET